MEKIKTARRIGIWLDHAKAHFIDISKGPAIIETVFSDKESEIRYKGESANGTLLGNNRATNNEHHKHNRERLIMDEYYRVLIDRLKNYDDILLFGPTSAKEELHNKLSADKHFANKAITIAPADQLTENQMVATVRDFFKE
jgi:stalled ribosome rescue protein Dom34